MNRALWVMVVSLSIALGAAPAFSEPASKPRMATASSSAAAISPSLFANSIEKAAGLVGKEAVTTAAILPVSAQSDVMEKLSNTVSKDFIIGAEDVLEITVWKNQDLSKLVQVRPDGRISLPIIRDVIAVGKTPSQLADEITMKLRDYVQNPAVAIAVREVNSYSVFLLGEVVKPGKYPLKSKTTLLQGITIAGGFTPAAARNQLVVFRLGENGTGEQMVKASYDDIVLRGIVSQNIELKAGDTVVVPSEAMVTFPGR